MQVGAVAQASSFVKAGARTKPDYVVPRMATPCTRQCAEVSYTLPRFADIGDQRGTVHD